MNLFFKIIIIAVAVVVAVGVAYILGKGGLGFGGGKGDGKGDGDAVSAVAEIEKDNPETEEINTVELRINGNEYIYNNDKYTLDEMQTLINKIKELDEISVKLIDDDASEKAFQGVEKALKENNIRIVKE